MSLIIAFSMIIIPIFVTIEAAAVIILNLIIYFVISEVEDKKKRIVYSAISAVVTGIILSIVIVWLSVSTSQEVRYSSRSTLDAFLESYLFPAIGWITLAPIYIIVANLIGSDIQKKSQKMKK